MKTRIHFLLLVCVLSAGWRGASQAAQPVAPEQPNIVLVLADDLGWTDLGCRGSGYYETPNIDRLAAQGVTFTSFYACQNCAPTRAALMSGQYAPRTGIYSVGTLARGRESDRKLVPPENATRLPLDKVTLAEVLKEAGYATGMFGKWHLGNGVEFHPSRRGFDEAVVSDGKHFRFKATPPVDVAPDVYLADFLTDRAVDFIERHRDAPFFLYLPHFAVHNPLQAKEEIIARYRDKPPAGGHNHPTYAAMIQSLDESVGRLMRTLDELELTSNTLLIFMSDNGGLGGYRVPGTDERKGTTDNAPLREGKGSLYEGGIRVPFIARWPAVIPAGSLCEQAAVHVDLYPTFLELCGGAAPADTVLDGVSLTGLFAQPGGALDREAIYWHFPGYLQGYIREATWRTTPVSVIRSGDYKLLEFLEDGRLELYHVRHDLGERQNLIQALPSKARALHAQLVAWRERTGALMPRVKTPEEAQADGNSDSQPLGRAGKRRPRKQADRDR